MAWIYLGLAVGLAGLAALFLSIGYADGRMPARARLAVASGELRDLDYATSRNSETLSFRIAGEPLEFQVPSQADDLDVLQAEIASASGPVMASYDATDRRHPWLSSGEDFYLVYALSRGGRTLLSYQQSARGFQADQRVGRWVGPACLLVGLYSLYAARTHWRHSRLGATGLRR